ncbi:MAG: sugar ABC transporter permease [Clostridiales bacterium]|nr:sugar ABC transporter permease [Clostridiales bacterium]
MSTRQIKTRAPYIPRRAGPGRVVVHIVLFVLLGALALGLGIMGRQRLIGKVDQMQNTLQANLFMDEGTALIKTALGEGQEDAIQRQLNTGMHSKKRGLKTAVTSLVEENAPEREAATLVIDTLYEGAISRLGEEGLKAGMKERFLGLREDLIASLTAQAEQLMRDTTLGDVRVGLASNEPYYPLMYYYTPLLALGAFLLLFAGALLFNYLRSDVEKRARLGQRLEPMDYLLPFFVGVALFSLYPVVRVVIMSFQEHYRLDGSFAGWGIGNYRYVIFGEAGTSNYFLQGLRNTMFYVLVTVPVGAALAIVIAYLLNQKLRFSALFQTTYFLPMVTSVTAVGMVWRWIFNQKFGLLNAILGWFGVDPLYWLGDISHSMTALIIFGIWNSLPFTIILLLSGLQNIDESYYTVARVDGARAFRIFRRITVPLLAPTISLVLIINSIGAFKVFSTVVVLFNGSPGPAKNLYTMVYYIYDMMHDNNRELGRAAAAAIVLFLIIFLFTMLQRFIQRRWQYD